MTRILAPLLVVVLVVILSGAAAVHLAGVLGQKEARTRAGLETEFHRAMIRPDLRPALLARIDAYLAESGGDAEARWFAAGLLLPLAEIDRAIDAVFQDEQVAADPASARRFAEAALRAVGFEDPQRLERPTPAAMACLLALADGQVPAALEQIDRIARVLATQAFLSIFEGAVAFTTGATSEHVAAALRTRGLDTTAVVAALATLNEAPYPERDDDIERLSKILAGNLRRREPLVWALAVLALGRSEDARALEALTRAAGNEAGGTDTDRIDQAIATTGLVAAGDWERRMP